MHAQDLARCGDLEALGRAAVRLEFQLLGLLLRHAPESFRSQLSAAAALVAPFFGASNATRTLPSMRGGVSINACSPISPSSRCIFARPTSWCAISRPRWKII